MADKNTPKDASAKSKAEGDRWESDSEAVERYDETTGDEGGGITNRPLGEEIDSQEAVPPRGESVEDAHAGRGTKRDDDRKEENR